MLPYGAPRKAKWMSRLGQDKEKQKALWPNYYLHPKFFVKALLHLAEPLPVQSRLFESKHMIFLRWIHRFSVGMIDVIFLLISVRNISLECRAVDQFSMYLMYSKVMRNFGL